MKTLRFFYFKELSILIFFMILAFAAKINAATIQVGKGSFVNVLPSGQHGPSNANNQPVTPSVTQQFSQIPQTNKWWTTLIWKFEIGNPYSDYLYALPLAFKATAAGMEVAYPSTFSLTPWAAAPNNNHNIQEYHYNMASDFTIGAVGLNAPETNVAGYSDWTVTSEWTNGNISLQTTIGKGLPYAYAIIQGSDAAITFASTPTVWYNQKGVLGVTVNGHNYGIFAPSGSVWNAQGLVYSSSLNGQDYLSVALLPDNQSTTLELFRSHAYAFVTNTEVSWQYNGTTSNVTTTYTLQTVLKEAGANNTNVNTALVALFRHQWMNSFSTLTGYTYVSPRGTLKLLVGNQFQTSLTFPGILPFLPSAAAQGEDGYNEATLYGYVNSLYELTPSERWGTNNGTDTYYFGKALCRIANIIPIADQVQHKAAKSLFLSEVESNLESWLAANSIRQFYYDSTWRTLIGYPSSFGTDVQMNDHHFHYGYFIRAAALVALYDPTWAEESNWGGMINLLIRDVANWDRTDNAFPFLRFFDVYEGHSWASGMSAFAAGNNEESSSEDLNFSTGTFLWGVATQNSAITSLGAFLYTNSISAIPQYWFDVDQQVFPSGFVPNTLGIVWGNGGAYSIWWNGTVEELHGINFLPMQPGMLYLGAYPDYLQANQAFMMSNGGTATANVWPDIHMEIKALYDPLDAIATFNSNPNYTPEGGETIAHTYHWIYNIDALGEVNTCITANTPMFGVFTKNGVKNYVAYNPTSASKTVKFSNGYSLVVPPNSISTSNQ